MDSERWQQVRQSGMTTKFITVNELKDGPLKQPRLREVINLVIDRSYLLEQLSGDVLEKASSFFQQSGQAPKGPDDAASLRTRDVKQLLASSGYQGEVLKLATIPQYEQDALLLQQVCARSGLMLDILLIPAEQFKGVLRMTADLLLFAVMLDEHRELRLYDMYKSMQQHAAPEVQTMLEDSLCYLRSESDAERRMALLEQLESQLKQRHSLLFLYRKHLKTAYHPSIRGMSLDSLGWVRFRDIWFT